MGLSAGAMMLGACWAEWPDAAEEGVPHDDGALVACSGVVPDLVVDCHAEEDGWAELNMVHAMLVERAALGGAGAGAAREAASPPPAPALPRLSHRGSGVVLGPAGSVESRTWAKRLGVILRSG